MHQQILKSNMVIQQPERAKHMETIATVLGIISSMLSIFATATSIKNKKEIKKIRDCYENNALTTNGNGNTQIMGNSNQVNTHAK